MNHYHPGQRALRASEFVPNKMLELIKNDLSWTITQRILESHAAAPPFADFGPYLEPLMFTLYTGKHRSKTSSMFIEAGRTEYPEHFEVCYLCQLTIWGFGEAVFALARERIVSSIVPHKEGRIPD
jgi:hypothetical protein